MIKETRTYQCTRCGISNIVKKEKTRWGEKSELGQFYVGGLIRLLLVW